ncbi:PENTATRICOPEPTIDE REPEAT-CONTAINING PROTEIN 1 MITOCHONDRIAL [Salix purpurea]|uniref:PENTATRICOPEPTIDE REPEAT-CONTAINING PROTEIN 1 MITOCHONDRIAL n=1 Tax=Salix purpurea TaxID=77065 RepID=A0A9Q0PPT2_SALPP|nr:PENTATRICOPEPTIDE REPEAT-CONTAINING PROTEIN 1 MITOCHONDRIAL [Salix purpurea]
MKPQPLSSTNMSWSLSISTPPPKNLLTGSNGNQDPQFLTIKSSKWSIDPTSTGLQRQSKKELSRILRTEAAIKAIEQKANSKKYNNLWPKAVLEALDDAMKENQWESALKIFELLRKQHWYEPRTKTYTKLLMMLGKCRQPEEGSLLFEVLLSDGLKPTVDVYTALVSVYGKSGQLDKAFSIVVEMKAISDCKPDVYTYSRIECSAVTYNTIIDGYGKAKMFEDMENTLTDMIESGSSVPDLFTFNSIIGAYGRSGLIDKMEKWYTEFQLMGLRQDIKTFNILIKSYGKAGMYGKMRSVLEFMEKRFFAPSIVTHNIVIETFGKTGDIKTMEEYFSKLKHLGIKPTTVTYCSLVSAYSKAGHIKKVDSILRQVENSDVILDTPFFNCVICAYGRAGDVEKMSNLFLGMEERKCKPDSITFATMIQAYNAQGMIEAAQGMENMMIATRKNSGTRLIGA